MISNLVKNQQRRGTIAVFLAKFWMTLAAVSIAINLLIVLTLVQMAPKLKAIAQILTTPMNTQQYIQIDTLPVRGLLDSTSISNRANRDLLDEMLVRYYLDRRYSSFSDKQEMQSRWMPGGDIWRLSSPSTYAKFSKNITQKITDLEGDRTTKSVDIVKITKLDNIYTVEFDIYSFDPHDPLTKPKVQRRVANIVVGHYRNRHIYSKLLTNPFGFYVQKYDEAVKK